MQIFLLNNFNNTISAQNQSLPSFGRGGKALDLKYIMENRSYILPQRVKNRAFTLLKSGSNELPSLLEIHKSIYEPLLKYTNLESLKKDFPEFKDVIENVVYKRHSQRLQNRTASWGDNFALNMIKKFWGELKTKDEIARELGLVSRTVLESPLKNINFVTYSPNYKTLLKASDTEGNRIIAEKTRLNNQKNPEEMYKRNKHAAQFCKKESYREAQRQRMYEYDKAHKERREKIAISTQQSWDDPRMQEIKDAMRAFSNEQAPFVKNAVVKLIRKIPMTEAERRVAKGFYKKFWEKHPELKELFSKVRKSIPQNPPEFPN